MNFKPPMNIAKRDQKIPTVFLAGTIEMGNSVNWQKDLSEYFSMNGWNVFNPRRDDWDLSWAQNFESSQFYQQVNWELDALEKADLIIMYLDPTSKSPISLLEFGLYAKSNKLVMICPDGFYRKGNIDIVCNRYNVQIFDDIDSFKSKYILN